MSSLQERDLQFIALGIPQALNYLSSVKIRCTFGCPRCHGSEPGCKTSVFQRELDPILRILRDDSLKYGDSFVLNRKIVHAFLRCRFSVSRSLAFQSFYSEIFETERLGLMSDLKKFTI